MSLRITLSPTLFLNYAAYRYICLFDMPFDINGTLTELTNLVRLQNPLLNIFSTEDFMIFLLPNQQCDTLNVP